MLNLMKLINISYFCVIMLQYKIKIIYRIYYLIQIKIINLFNKLKENVYLLIKKIMNVLMF